MKLLSRFIKSFILIALISPLFLLADGENVHIKVGTRSSAEPQEEPLEEIAALDERQTNNQWAGYIFDSYPPVYYPASIHWLFSVSAFGDSIELEDGSVWKVSYYDQYKANNWRAQDPLIITQNHRWFSKYVYKIINKATGASIETNLHFGPIKNGEHTLYITSLDSYQKKVRLISGREEVTHWEICTKDWAEFDKWEPYDAIIVGYNSGWDSHYECILINVAVNNFVRARQL